MLWLWIILLIILLFLLMVLFSPVRIIMDTEDDRYLVSYGWFFSGRLMTANGEPAIRVRIFGFPWSIPFRKFLQQKPEALTSTEETRSIAKQKAKQHKKPMRLPLRKVKALLRAIHVQKLEIDLDTDNFLWNAWLFPVLWLADGKRRLRTNFNGHTIIRIYLLVIPVQVLWVVIRA